MAGVTVVVGGQYGSEGKGNLIACRLAHHDVHVRVGSPNAGHTIFDPVSGDKFKMQSIPCGWINRKAALIIGAGAIIDPYQFQKELTLIENTYDPYIRTRIVVDRQAFCITEADSLDEKRKKLDEQIGSTTEGVGIARSVRIARTCNLESRQAASVLKNARVNIMDTVELLHHIRYRTSSSILVEGTQGSGLSLYHGSYPYVTSTDSNACGILSECGLAPGPDINVIMVVRTFPIRVAGNSGPLHDEINWEQLSKRLGKEVLERTTVTKKIRRIGGWDQKLFEKSVMLNNPNSIAVMFADYVDPEMSNVTKQEEISLCMMNWLNDNIFDHTVSYIGTGEKSVIKCYEENIDDCA